MNETKDFQYYPKEIREHFEYIVQSGQLRSYLLEKYPIGHQINSDKQLYDYTCEIKQKFMKKSPPISKVKYEKRKDLIRNALGTHKYVNRSHGGKIKSKHEIRVSECLKDAPEEMLRMLVVHELAHFKEKDHNKAFYNLCEYMLPNYCEVEVDTLLYLNLLDQGNSLY